MDNSGKSPVIAGLAAGIAFVAVFSFVFSDSSLAVTKGNNEINLTIDGIRSSYRPGDQIVFGVSAKGLSDNACNIGSPGVSIHGGSDEEKINWPISFAFYTAMMCGGSEYLDKKWIFGDEPEDAIVLDTAGQYTLVVSIEDITAERKFVVTG